MYRWRIWQEWWRGGGFRAMFGEVAFALRERSTRADYSNMKPAFAHLSPTVPATFALAIGISLSVFLLLGVGDPGEPTPLLPAIGGAVGRVAADLSATANDRASEPVGKTAFSAQLVATRTVHFVLQRRQAATKTHRVRARTGVVQRAPSAPMQVAAPAAPATPVTTSRFFSTLTTARGKARGHGHGRALKPTTGATAPRVHGHGKASGRSSEHHHGLAPGHRKKAPTASSPAPVTPPKVNGDGNGHKGGKK
jgi:hypothetical protein